jgi:hypothetical protein
MYTYCGWEEILHYLGKFKPLKKHKYCDTTTCQLMQDFFHPL